MKPTTPEPGTLYALLACSRMMLVCCMTQYVIVTIPLGGDSPGVGNIKECADSSILYLHCLEYFNPISCNSFLIELWNTKNGKINQSKVIVH